MIKESFFKAEPCNFPKGLPVNAFTEDQISAVLKIVVDQTVKASCDILESVIQKTQSLSLGPDTSQALTPVGLRGHSARKPGASDISGAPPSNDDFSGIGYSFETLRTEKIAASPTSMDKPTCSSTYSRSEPVEFNVDSPVGQTLASLKSSAIKDKKKHSHNQRGQFALSSRGTGSRRNVTRSCKILKDARF